MAAACALARWQEPLFLRTQQVELTWHAIPMFAAVMCLGLTVSVTVDRGISVNRICGPVVPFVAGLVMAVTTSVVAATIGCVLDLGFGTSIRWPQVASSITYPITRLAPPIALGIGLMRSRLAPTTLIAAVLGATVVMIILLGSEPLGVVSSPRTLGVSSLATLGSLGVTTFLCDTRRLP
ncbi:MAG: hypothetical protein IPK26_18950 [Planctomycetes bacterium]|nr:hypothetical protein [Planctomycetota bacterium]